MISSLEGWPTKAKEAPPPHEVSLNLLVTNPVFQYIGEEQKLGHTFWRYIGSFQELDFLCKSFERRVFILKKNHICGVSSDCKLNAKAVELRFFIDSFTIIVVI